MQISVIVPTYRPKDYLWECLDSMVHQTFPKDKFELILILNGCSEPWKTQIQSYVTSHMQGVNVTFVQVDEGGVSNARNIGLNLAKGKFIAFIDDDDYVSENYLEELFKLVSDDTVVLCYPYAFNDQQISPQLSYSLTTTYDRLSRLGGIKTMHSVRKFFSGPCMKLIPVGIIGANRFDVAFKNGEDSLFMFLISDKIKQVKFSSPQAVYYRRYRINSAYTIKKSFLYKLINSTRLIISYTKIYFSSPCRYKVTFYISRIIGALKSLFN